MKQFLLGKNVAYGSGSNPQDIADGAFAFAYNNDGQFTVSTDGTDILSEAMIVLGRDTKKGGPVTIPFYPLHVSATKAVYEEGSTFEAAVTVEAPFIHGTYTIVVVLKGMKFNYRNKWSASVIVTPMDIKKGMTAEDLAEKLVKAINSQGQHGVTAEAAGAVIAIKANHEGIDYNIVPADFATGWDVTIGTIGSKSFMDAKYIRDLADKAAADAGFEYTYKEASDYLYPNYPLNPLKNDDLEDTGFVVYTVRFAEPRDVKTRDEVVHQIVQLAVPTNSDCIGTLDTILTNLAGKLEAAGEDSGSDIPNPAG